MKVTTPPDKVTVRNSRMALGSHHQLALSALDVAAILRLRSTSLGEAPPVKITLKPLPYEVEAPSAVLKVKAEPVQKADLSAEALAKAEARIAELEALNAELQPLKACIAELEAVKAKAEADGLRRTRLQEATRAAGGRVYEPRNAVPMLTLAGRPQQHAVGSRKPGWLSRLAFWR